MLIDALRVDVHHLVDVRRIEVDERAVRTDAGVRDDDVEAAVARDRLVDERRDLGAIADVGRPGDGAGDAEVVARARGEAELDALVGEHAGDGGADAAARSGDDCHLSFESRHGVRSFTVSSAGYSARKRA